MAAHIFFVRPEQRAALIDLIRRSAPTASIDDNVLVSVQPNSITFDVDENQGQMAAVVVTLPDFDTALMREASQLLGTRTSYNFSRAIFWQN